MARSSKKHKREDTAFLYTRISRDDDLVGDSYSISNQKKLLAKAAKDLGYTNLVYFCDDGVSGVTMNRPEFVEMIKQLELGKAAAVFVKDLSRLGRNYIEVGRLTEEFFPEHDIRLVAVSDGIDTCEGESEFAPIKNLFNEWYARDISKKRRISYKIKGNSGIPIGPPPYGYILRPDGSGLWDIDEEAAAVLRKIASLRLDGLGTNQIAEWLTEHKILTPVAYKKLKGQTTRHKPNENPYLWKNASIYKLLTMQEYCGDVINFKTYSKSYKNKKRHPNDPENMVIFRDVNPAIWSRDTFERLQTLSEGTRKRKPKEGEQNMFAGFLKCADCGRNLNYHFNQRNHDIKYFNCPGYNQGKRKICQSTHYIRVDFLEQVVLSEIRRLTRFACRHEDAFTTAVADYSKKAMEADQRVRESELRALIARNNELDLLFEKIYEDNALGKISDERFKKLADKYEEEQQSIADRIAELKQKFDEATSKVANTDTFLAAVRKYTKIKKLTPRILAELIDHIEVHQAEIVEGGQIQKIVIVYNCIGTIEIPEEVNIPLPQITMKTRQGVAVTYDPLPLATI
ncbi:MAG: recombinase family protein [Oscillospiraceae bacterium]|nr:recombinase family protein [Oscillospiraceae bacterium]